MRRVLSIVLCMLLSAMTVCFAAQSTEGTEFWATFLNNENTREGSSIMRLSLIASSRENATVTVQNPQMGWKTSFYVTANKVAQLEIPHAQCYNYYDGSVQKRGLKVTSTAPISLYASNFREYTYDATIVLPVTALGKDYIIQIFENELMAKEFGIVATTNNTQVTITPHARTSDGHVKNASYIVTLNAGETYQVMSEDGGSDFSGSRVEANHPIAVFAGHKCINVPTGNPWCDHIVEQQMPTQMWGKQFALTKTGSMNSDRVMITAKEDGTVVKVNGSTITTLKALQSYTYRLTANSAFVETSQPAACFLYIEGARDNDMMGDPSSVHISPVEQRIQELTFATFQTDVSRTHYVNVVTTAAGAAGMQLDGRNISGQFSTLVGNPSLRFARINIAHGTHTLRTNADGFTGHVYGLGHCESYAYTFGSATLILDGSILVDGEPHADIIYTDERCYKASIHFAAQANVEYTSIHWDFGDGTTSAEDKVAHTYSSPGQYTITMAIANEDGRDTARTTITLYETVHDTIHAAICEGEKYTINGYNYTTDGKYTIPLISKAGCDSILTLFLTVNKKRLTIEDAEFNKGSSFRWHDRWYNSAGTYRDTMLSAEGCDSIIELHLVEVDPTEITCDTLCWQEYYPFHGYHFPLPPIDGYEDRNYINYTLAYTDKEKCITYKTNLAIIPKDGNGVFEIHDTIQYGQTYEWLGEKYTEEGMYYKVMGGGSDCRQEYTLYLTVLPFPITQTTRNLCHTDTVMWRGLAYNEPGIYTDTAYTLLGIEGIYRLVLTDTRSSKEISVNHVEYYDFNGKHLTTSGTYCDTLTNSTGCDSVVILHLGIHEPCEIRVEESKRLCEGETLPWNDLVCEPGNDYTKSFTSVGGCDSIVTLHLEKLEKKHTLLEETICEGDYFRVGEYRFSDEGEHVVHFTAANGCDSTVTLQLHHKPTWTDDTTKVTINIGESYEWEHEIYRKSGLYTKGFIATNGCDSIRVLRLKVNMDCQTDRDTAKTLCFGEKFTWYGTVYDEEGDYTHLLHFDDRCDTLVTLHLTVLPKSEGHETKFIFTGESYPWHGQTYDETGVYEYHTTDSHGCDSTAYLHLTVSDKPIIDSSEYVTQCAGESYPWHGQTLVPTPEQYIFTHRLEGEDADTVITLTFSLWPRYDNISFTEYICDGQSYIWEGDGYAAGGEYTAEGDYTRTFTTIHGCDSIVTLHLRLWPKYEGIVDEQEICEGESYVWEGTPYTESTEVTRTLSTVHGCDSIVTFRLTVHPAYDTTDEAVTLCYGEHYKWNGETYDETGNYTQHLQSVHGCDSTVHISITFRPKSEGHETKFVFTGESYPWHGQTYDETGVYEYHTTDSHGCDSTAYLHLTVSDKPIIDSSEYVTQCAGESYPWHGQTLVPTPEQYIFTHRLEGEDADTVITLTFSLWPRYDNISFTEYICDGQSYIWEGDGYAAGGEYTAEGDYTRTFTTIHGCDSIVTLHLRLWPKYEGIVDEQEICEGESYVWEGTPYTESTEVTRTLSTVHGCDSIVTFRLTVHPAYDTTDEAVTLCYGEHYKWNGETYDETGNYTQHLQSVHGCDSTVHISITFRPKSGSEKTEYICEGEKYTWEGIDYTEAGDHPRIFTDRNGCDSTVILHLHTWSRYEDLSFTEHICEGEKYTWEGVDYTAEDDYTRTFTTVHGCDSVVTLHLRLWPRYDNVIDEQTRYSGESFTWQGVTYTEDTEVTRTLTTIHGCDSIVTLVLRFYDKKIETRDVTVNLCEGESYNFYGEILSENTEKTVTRIGDETDTIVTLQLFVWPSYHVDVRDTMLNGQPYIFENQTFTQPGVYTVTGTTAHNCDSVVTLYLDENNVSITSFENYDACDDNNLLEMTVQYTGVVDSTGILLRNDKSTLYEAHVPMPSDGFFHIPIPPGTRSCICSVTLYFHGMIAAQAETSAVLHYPSSVLEQAWNDVVAVLTHDYNGGYDFVAFQWYENGVLLPGETKAYLYRQLIMGGEYSAMLTETDGTKMMTCPLIATQHTDLTLYPTVVQPNQIIRCTVAEEAEITIYDAMGRAVLKQSLTIGENLINAPSGTGVFTAKVMLSSGNEKTYKLIIR